MGAATEVKIVSDAGGSLKVAGYGVVFGGSDVVGDFFTADTDFWADDASKTPPVLYQHGQDESLKRTRVGKVTSVHTDDTGMWVEAQLNASSKYLDAIRQLVAKGVLGWSSGSVGHLVDRVKMTDGRKQITSWPIFEFSLTPTPAEPRTLGVRAMKALGVPIMDDDYETVEDGEKAQQGLARSDYAWVDSDGVGHLDISDEGHVRAAMARFNQTHFTEDGAKRSAARKIIARAHSMGIEVSPDSAVANAAKGATLNDLPDDAFGYVEPGFLDDSGKTSPRTHRHFAHHDADGNVDAALLELAIVDARKSDVGGYALSHLLRHQSGEDDAHTKFWAHESAAGQVLVAATELTRLSEEIVTAQKHMDYLGYAQASGRIQPEVLQALKECMANLEAVIAHAEQAETGDDGTVRAEYLRRRLALLEV